MNDLQQVKELIKEEKEYKKTNNLTPIVIDHNKDRIIFQFVGWDVEIFDDGTWLWTDTTGG